MASEEILQGLRAYHQDGDVIELRIPEGREGKPVISGYFNDLEKLAEAASKYSQLKKYPGIYATLNPIRPDVIARANNKIRKTQDKTKDTEITELGWLPIDVDAVRVSGVSSNNIEHDLALDKTEEIKVWLISRGWPGKAFIKADSGNGGHLPVRIQLANNQENIDLLERCLMALDFIFSDESVKIDTQTFNPSRIWKLPGTWVCKGEDMPDRPHRMATLLGPPDLKSIEIVSREQLAALAAILPHEDKFTVRGSKFDPAKYAEEHGANILKIKSSGEWETVVLEECPFNSSHSRGEAIIGVRKDGMRSFSCRHDSCSGYHWAELKAKWGAPSGDKNSEKSTKPNALQIIEPSINSWIEQHHFKTAIDTEKLYHYEHGVYLDNGEAIVKALVEADFSTITNNTIVADVIGKVKRRTFTDPDKFNKERLINLRNGLLDIETLELRPHSPKILSTSQLDIMYNPEAKAPRIQQFLKEVAQPGDIALIEELLGWLLWLEYHIHKAIMMLGPGRNGKGTLLRLITNFLGAQNIANRTIQELVTDRFAKADLFGKMANLGGDLPDKDLSETSAFKGLTGGDRQSAQDKYKPAFNFTNKAKLIFSAQKPPKSSDDSYAFYSRWILIEFLNIFDVQKGTGDPDLDAKLSTSEELSGLLNIALAGLKRLRDNRWQFSYKLTVEDVELMYKRMANPVLAFLLDECVEDESNYIAKTIFFARFKEYAQRHGLKPTSTTKFGQDLRDQSEIPISDYRPYSPGGKALPRCWLGVQFRQLNWVPVAEREDVSIPSIDFRYPSASEKMGDSNREVGYNKNMDGMGVKTQSTPSIVKPTLGKIEHSTPESKINWPRGDPKDEEKSTEQTKPPDEKPLEKANKQCLNCKKPVKRESSDFCPTCELYFKDHPEREDPQWRAKLDTPRRKGDPCPKCRIPTSWSDVGVLFCPSCKAKWRASA